MSSDGSVNISLFRLLKEELGESLPPIQCTKATLVHLSHTLEDLILTQKLPAVLFTGFQESSHWRVETERYRALANIAQQVCIFAGGKLPPESHASELHVTLRGDDPLRQEWFVLILCTKFAALLCGQDQAVPVNEEARRQFETIWSFEPKIIKRVVDLLEEVVAQYRPDRLEALQKARAAYPPKAPDPAVMTKFTSEIIRFEETLNQKLHQTTAMLTDQLHWREDLTATLVHDMRTPLQGVGLALDMLRHEEEFNQATFQHLLSMAKRGTDNLLELVQLILDTNKLAVGKMNIVWKPLQPNMFITETIEALQPLMADRNIQHQIQVDPKISILWGDEGLLGRVMQNLISNAIKYTNRNGQVDIKIEIPAKTDTLHICVRDTGSGIDSTALPHIFDRYYRAPGDNEVGNGLGLYFCRLVAEAHGGSIRATSQIGIGTTITLVLPTKPPL
ncbi:MAG: ATP-binding protein [Chloroflexota bacterium]